MTKTITILSMLHERPERNSATRRFRDRAVLQWTLHRLGRAATILCWDDQAEAVRGAIGDMEVAVSVRGSRQGLRQMDAVTAARKWADGWRGGLLGACEFDRGFYAPWAEELRQEAQAENILLVDPAAGLIDPVLIEGLLTQAQSRDDVDLWFSPAAPGLSGLIIRPALMQQLVAARGHPGALLSYRPDLPRRDPIADPACVAIPVPLARTTHRFSLDSQRQIDRISAATAHLNGELISIEAMGLLAAVEGLGAEADARPRELVVELTTRRATDAIFRAGKRLNIERGEASLQGLRPIFAELAARDDARLVLGGVGDPLLHKNVLDVIAAARDAGIGAIALESDFAGVPQERIAGLARSGIDIVSVHLPAANGESYRAVMGIDAMNEVLSNVKLFLETRKAAGADVPLLAPTFMKCRQNQGEMEAWYDHWLRVAGCAVLASPSCFGGLIEDVSAVDMTPPRRRACGSLWSRLMVLADGTIVSCEQDVLASQGLGSTISGAWEKAGEMRRDHLAQQWAKHPACGKCREWHRA